MNDRAWREMLAEFRALGGIADNICLRQGVHGRGVRGRPATMGWEDLGEPGWDRTIDPLIKSQMLYR